MRGSCQNVVSHELTGPGSKFTATVVELRKKSNNKTTTSNYRNGIGNTKHKVFLLLSITLHTSSRIFHFETMMLQLSFARMRSFTVFWLPLLIAFCTTLQTASAASSDDENSETTAQQQFKNDRQAAKPWYTQSMSSKFPISPVTVAVLLTSIVYVLSSWAGPVYNCQASHILIQEHDEETKQKLENLKKTIQADVNLFRKTAKEVSSCPSKNQGGYLGQFKRGAMAPAFDRVCFDPKTPLETTVGPIQTQFGWHLIYIHERKMP
jgi:peptidyl-prolyl cis-trans isomerase C